MDFLTPPTGASPVRWTRVIFAIIAGWAGRKGTDRPLYKQEGHLVTDRTVSAEQFGKFLVAISDEWLQRDVGRVFVTTFDVALGNWLGQHNACVVSPTCGTALAM